MSALGRTFNIDDLALLAKRRLPAGLYEFIDRGAEDEVTARENSAAIKRVLVRQRVGIDTTGRNPAASLFGVAQSMPIGLGVTGLAGMLAYKGEQALARAAAKAGVPFTIGSSNFAGLAELNEICGDLLWRQLYPPRDDALLEHHLSVTREAGVRVLVITLDSPIAGNREYMLRNGFMPHMLNSRAVVDMLTSPHWFLGTLLRYWLNGGLPQLEDMPEGHKAFFGKGFNMRAVPADNYSWDNIRDIRRRWQGVLIVKGISTPEDALIAAGCGADGLIVSNHGGRSLDGCVSSMGALPSVVDAVGGRMTVMVDGGFKRGVDVLKAIAIGADAVMLGRATVFGLAAGGEAGVTRALQLLRAEMDRGLAMMGARSVGELNRDMLEIPVRTLPCMADSA